jgi:hypothetical protein
MESGQHRSDPSPAAPAPLPAPERRAGDRQALLGAIGAAVHGVFFLAVAGLALLRFGAIFDVVSGIIAALALMSLRQAWSGLRTYLAASRVHRPSPAKPLQP